ncbi:Ku protein [Halomonas sp. HP20-15]|uniref:non-homologous end joining protein Ku n=1 Tax=Halomonas sp. HP20-15 TaxID=3085901 RepID=UPI002982A0C7|nr:Ku protein [Halomonas sp. HP20-15]MDW5376674.1 Ku protein [Halomonas sp. HP20-15]
MADSRRRTKKSEDDKRPREASAVRGPRPFWSGTISFGLVNLPVGLYPAQHGKPVRLRMVDDQGTPLARRYYCEKEAKILTGSELIRGYEVERDDYVLVEDDELEALAPEKSQEIDLERFVALDEIPPIYFERAYFLTPEEGATRAYRLLADSMEAASRAGIASFVMRGKQYLVAIIAEGGILRAETLRYHDELRTPESIGLPERRAASSEARRRIGQAIDACASRRLERSWLENADAKRILERIDAKLERDEDVVWPDDVDVEDEEGGEVIDLMQVLKQSLAEGRSPAAQRAGGRQSADKPSRREARETGKQRETKREAEGEESRDQPRKSGSKRTAGKAGSGSRSEARARKSKGDDAGERRRSGRRRGRQSDDGQLSELTRQALYQRAQEMDIAGRSQMTKAELIKAIQSAA